MKNQKELEKRARSIGTDDPFRNIFLQVSKRDSVSNVGVEDKNIIDSSIEEVDEIQEISFEPTKSILDYELTQDMDSRDPTNRLINEEPAETNEDEESPTPEIPDWRDEAYWRLPEKVRIAIDGAKEKS